MRLVLRLALSVLLVAQGISARAQSGGEADERPALRLAAIRIAPGDEHRGMVPAQAMPGMPPMMMPMPIPEGGMGGMATMMTGETLAEMMAAACAAGLFIGGVAGAAATAPVAPATPLAVAGSAALGCGFAVAATAAGMLGMLGWRALHRRVAAAVH